MIYTNAPDWVMLGVTTNDGVFVFASNELTQAELRKEVDVEIGWFGERHVVDSLEHYEINVETRSLTWAQGVDYADAIRNLMKNWQPQPRASLEATVRRHPSNIPEIGS